MTTLITSANPHETSQNSALAQKNSASRRSSKASGNSPSQTVKPQASVRATAGERYTLWAASGP
jgi:hypothetical protein